MRSILRFIVGTAATCLVASCSDVATAPVQNSASRQAPSFDFGKIGGGFGLAPASMTLTANGGTFTIGQYTLSFPANSVCDPTISTYGPSEWDAPCVTLHQGQSVFVFAALSLTANGLAVDFAPALRFAPNTTVTIATNAFASTIKNNLQYYQQNPSALNSLVMYYAPGPGAPLTMDFANDPSVITHVNLTTGLIWRRVKHFSGYLLTNGMTCTPSADLPECIQIDH